MKNPARLQALIIAAATFVPATHASPPPGLCKALRSFVESVQSDEQREFTFRTSWGENFKDAPEPAIAAKRCEHGGYKPAQEVCANLMENGSTEFAGINAKNTIICLSRRTRFAPLMQLHNGSFSFGYGSHNRGALIDVTLQEDAKFGGMALHVVADGY